MLKIGDFSRLAQVSIKTLRYYDENGLLNPAEVDRFTGYRYYTLDQLPQLNRILMLKDLGLSLEQVAMMLHDDFKDEDIRRMLHIKRAQMQQEIKEAQARLTRLENRLKQIEMEDKMKDYEVVIKRIDAQKALCLRQIVAATADIPRMFNDVGNAFHNQPIKQTGPWIALYHHAGYREHDLDIELAIPVEASAKEDEVMGAGMPLSLRTIPPVETAATVLVQGSYEQFSSAYGALNTYIHAHGHNYLGPAREVYLRGPGDTDDPAEYLTEIQYPVGEFSTEIPADGTALPSDWQDMNTKIPPFSRRARTALEFARSEAAALEQLEISPAHVLLGLLRDSAGFAANIFTDLGITADHLRSLLPGGIGGASEPLVSDAAQAIITHADAEARSLGHDYIGTEHLLLGLLRQQDKTITHLLNTNGISAEQVRSAIMNTLNR